MGEEKAKESLTETKTEVIALVLQLLAAGLWALKLWATSQGLGVIFPNTGTSGGWILGVIGMGLITLVVASVLSVIGFIYTIKSKKKLWPLITLAIELILFAIYAIRMVTMLMMIGVILTSGAP